MHRLYLRYTLRDALTYRSQGLWNAWITKRYNVHSSTAVLGCAMYWCASVRLSRALGLPCISCLCDTKFVCVCSLRCASQTWMSILSMWVPKVWQHANLLQVMTTWYAVRPQVAGRNTVMEQQAGFKPSNFGTNSAAAFMAKTCRRGNPPLSPHHHPAHHLRWSAYNASKHLQNRSCCRLHSLLLHTILRGNKASMRWTEYQM